MNLSRQDLFDLYLTCSQRQHGRQTPLNEQVPQAKCGLTSTLSRGVPACSRQHHKGQMLPMSTSQVENGSRPQLMNILSLGDKLRGENVCQGHHKVCSHRAVPSAAYGCGECESALLCCSQADKEPGWGRQRLWDTLSIW